MTQHCAQLTDRTVLALTGPDTLSFLQGLITNDAEKITANKWLYGGLLTPQGKYLHDFFLIKEAETILLDCAAAQVDSLLRRLTMYRLRSDVSIEKTDRSVFAHWGQTDQGFGDPRSTSLGQRIFEGSPNADLSAYNAHRITLGIPEGPLDFLAEKTLWLETNADLLAGVDFQKGCYVGQELTARMRYRGKVRRRLVRIEAREDIPANSPILLGEREIGDTRSSAGSLAIANLKVEDWMKAGLTAGGVSIKASPPDWQKPIIETENETS